MIELPWIVMVAPHVGFDVPLPIVLPVLSVFYQSIVFARA
jgi:hypothetical protein